MEESTGKREQIVHSKDIEDDDIIYVEEFFDGEKQAGVDVDLDHEEIINIEDSNDDFTVEMEEVVKEPSSLTSDKNLLDRGVLTVVKPNHDVRDLLFESSRGGSCSKTKKCVVATEDYHEMKHSVESAKRKSDATAKVESASKELDHRVERGNREGAVKGQDVKEITSTGDVKSMQDIIQNLSKHIGGGNHESSESTRKMNFTAVSRDSALESTQRRDANLDAFGILKPDKDERMRTLEMKYVESINSCPDKSLKHITAKYTCIGPAQHVSRPAFSKPPTSTSPSSLVKQSTAKRIEKFIVRNISKVSKIYKVSNLSYKIKPVRKNLSGKNCKCPVIYIGEPTFGDLDDFYSLSSTAANQPIKVKEEDLYDIDQLRNSFLPNEYTTQSTPKPQNLHPDFSHPNMKNLHRFQTNPPVNFSQLLIPPNQFSYTPAPNFSLGNIVRIVARTIPSATLANHATTVTSKLVTTATMSQGSAVGSSSPAIPPKVTTHGGFVKMPDKNRKIVPIPNFSTKASPLTIVMPPGMHSEKLSSSLPPKTESVMTMKLLPTSMPSSMKKNNSLPTAIPPRVLPKLSTSVAFDAGKGKALSTIVFVPSSKDLSFSPTSKTPVAKKDTQFFNAPASRAIVKLACAAKPGPVTPFANIYSAKSSTPSQTAGFNQQSSKPFPQSPLREGVEVAFEDGVRHFITSLRQMTYLDDEPVKRWSDLKKGTKVTAKWTDGLIYDATVVGRYFSAEKQLQPLSQIGCTQCKVVFSSITSFRQHQKCKCRIPGTMVSKNMKRVTDSMVTASKNGKESDEEVTVKEPLIKGNKRKMESEGSSKPCKTSKNGKGSDGEVTEKEPLIQSNKRKMESEKSYQLCKIKKVSMCKAKSVTPKFAISSDKNGSDEIFKVGTRFLHRWQLNNGKSQWYEGRVISVICDSAVCLDREYEVSYKGENENYFLKLYEDYPGDIRIMGKS